jgi:hypothetical protein
MNLNFYVFFFVCSLRKIVQSIVLYAALIQIDKKHIVESHFMCTIIPTNAVKWKIILAAGGAGSRVKVM